MPRLPLIAVEPSSNVMLVLSGTRRLVRSVSDLVVVIQKEGRALAEDPAQAAAVVKPSKDETRSRS
jgi:hypothetical protein